MTKYIDADALCEFWLENGENEHIYDTNDFLESIDNTPTADVKEVRHAHWMWYNGHWECSNCRGSRFHDLVLGLDATYCGHCGAKMDKEES